MDKDSADVAGDVYRWTLVGTRLDIKRSAEGLHRAVRELRDRTRKVAGLGIQAKDDALVWAPFIHIGV